MSIRRGIALLLGLSMACNRPQIDPDTGGEIDAQLDLSGVQTCPAPEERQLDGAERWLSGGK